MEWNNQVQLFISDVDETIADLYVEAVPDMISELEKILAEGKVLFLISGQCIKNIRWRIIDHIKSNLRQKILVGHCSGAEVWGFDESGDLKTSPYYSYYEKSLSEAQKKRWREIIFQLIEEFHLKTFPTMPIYRFDKISNKDPLSIMIEDRGPQITLEVVNGYDLSSSQALITGIPFSNMDNHNDLRIPIMERAKSLFTDNFLPITPRLAGVFAIDFALQGVSKTTAVRYVIEHNSLLVSLGIHPSEIFNPETIEVWGDKFSTSKGGTDRHISESLTKDVRSITFREEDPKDFPEGYNIVVWKGKNQLHEGLLEYLKSRGG